MELKDAVAVVTGANRGLGRHLAAQLVARGAKVYAAARRPEAADMPGVVPLRLDLTDEASIREAARTAADATLLVNNAGVSTGTPLIAGSPEAVRLEMEVNFFGPLAVTRAFAPVIESNGGGAVLNVLSVLSWLHPAGLGAYAAAKAAAWALTGAAREELAPRGIAVTALHVGYMDTDMAAGVPAEQKTDPAEVAAQALSGIETGPPEILADDTTRYVKQRLAAPPNASWDAPAPPAPGANQQHAPPAHTTSHRRRAGPLLRQPVHVLSSRPSRRAARRGVTYSFLFMRADGDQLRGITRLVEAGRIRPVVDRTREAMDYAEKGRARAGEVVIATV
ncbi:SDR family NAD(P)-dependent oxidoreductase [Streptomyces sp. JB150]|nr:SDR family NAD(P)-dependent oxidoreductase [Streptomyces sp. JB150]